jgi:hypothetical protein
VRLRYFCSPQHTESALYPIVGHMARAAGLARDDEASTKLDKLDALLATTATSREDAALLAEMLSIRVLVKGFGLADTARINVDPSITLLSQLSK